MIHKYGKYFPVFILVFLVFSLRLFGEEYQSLPETEPQGNVARIIIFSDKTCEECHELKTEILPALLKKYPNQIACRFYDIDNVSNFLLMERFEKKHGKAQNEVPILFLDGKVRSGLKEEITEQLEQDIKIALAKGGSSWLEPAPETAGSSESEEMDARLKSITLVAILGAGLSDGINPCAFTTIIFLISYLSLIGRKKKEIIQTGIVYTTAVFLTYLAMGIALKDIINRIVNITSVSKIIYGVTAGIAFLVAVLSIRDYTLALKGRYKDMTLKLSDGMQKRIHKSIHDKIKNLGVVTAALVLGILVAMFELPCTGQIYAPIIIALSYPQLRSRALFYLVLYNLMFIVPLVFVFIVAYFGVSSKSIGERFRRHLAIIKLVMGIVFLLIGGVLVFMAIH